jgi:hypothetical protein
MGFETAIDRYNEEVVMRVANTPSWWRILSINHRTGKFSPVGEDQGCEPKGRKQEVAKVQVRPR